MALVGPEEPKHHVPRQVDEIKIIDGSLTLTLVCILIAKFSIAMAE